MNAITLTCDFNYGTAATLRHIVCVVQQCTMHRSAMHLHPNHSAGNVMGALLACAAALLLPRGVFCADNISHYDSIEDTKIYSIWASDVCTCICRHSVPQYQGRFRSPIHIEFVRTGNILLQFNTFIKLLFNMLATICLDDLSFGIAPQTPFVQESIRIVADVAFVE